MTHPVTALPLSKDGDAKSLTRGLLLGILRARQDRSSGGEPAPWASGPNIGDKSGKHIGEFVIRHQPRDLDENSSVIQKNSRRLGAVAMLPRSR